MSSFESSEFEDTPDGSQLPLPEPGENRELIDLSFDGVDVHPDNWPDGGMPYCLRPLGDESSSDMSKYYPDCVDSDPATSTEASLCHPTSLLLTGSGVTIIRDPEYDAKPEVKPEPPFSRWEEPEVSLVAERPIGGEGRPELGTNATERPDPEGAFRLGDRFLPFRPGIGFLAPEISPEEYAAVSVRFGDFARDLADMWPDGVKIGAGDREISICADETGKFMSVDQLLATPEGVTYHVDESVRYHIDDEGVLRREDIFNPSANQQFGWEVSENAPEPEILNAYLRQSGAYKAAQQMSERGKRIGINDMPVGQQEIEGLRATIEKALDPFGMRGPDRPMLGTDKLGPPKPDDLLDFRAAAVRVHEERDDSEVWISENCGVKILSPNGGPDLDGLEGDKIFQALLTTNPGTRSSRYQHLLVLAQPSGDETACRVVVVRDNQDERLSDANRAVYEVSAGQLRVLTDEILHGLTKPQSRFMGDRKTQVQPILMGLFEPARHQI